MKVYPSSDLQPDGTFWAMLHSSGTVHRLYEDMTARLTRKLSRSQDLYTPVFFNPQDFCAAVYEQGRWGRARIEEIRKDWVSSLYTLYMYSRYMYYYCVYALGVHSCIAIHDVL